MTTLLDEMGYNYAIFNGIDGRQVALSILAHFLINLATNVLSITIAYRSLNDSYLEDDLGIRYLDSGLEDFEGNNKKMRKGQVGCFLSHYTIWKKVRAEA